MMNNGDPPHPTLFTDPMDHIPSPSHYDVAALHRFLPSNAPDDGLPPAVDDNSDFPADAFSCDNFRMFEFKVRRCARARSHDWTDCPFAHPGEKARRRDPRRHRYSGSACPDYRRGACVKGDACEHAHGVFETWLHPSRYRTQPCKDGTHCRRRICFFAHTPTQLRVPTSSPDVSPRKPEHDPFVLFGTSPNSGTFISPPSSPVTSGESLKLSLKLSKMKVGVIPGHGSGLGTGPWGLGFGSPRGPARIRPVFVSLPTTPVRAVNRSGLSPFDAGENEYAKLGEDDSLDRVDPVGAVPDFGWVSELVK